MLIIFLVLILTHNTSGIGYDLNFDNLVHGCGIWKFHSVLWLDNLFS